MLNDKFTIEITSLLSKKKLKIIRGYSSNRYFFCFRLKMKNHFTVTIGNNRPSVFYWYEAKSIDNLKKCIEKRFEIPASCQEIVHNGKILNTETYKEIYEKRMHHNNVEFNLTITEKSIDPDIVRYQRCIAQDMKSNIRNIKLLGTSELFPENFKFHIYYRDLDTNTTFSDLKNKVQAENNVGADKIFFLGQGCNLLADNQLLVDSFLDDRQDLDKFFIRCTTSEKGANGELSKIKISIKRLENEETTIEYPTFEFGSINLEDIRCFIRESFPPLQIPEDQQFLYHHDSLQLVDDKSFINYWYEKTSVGEDVHLKLSVVHTEDQELRDHYNRNDIKMKDPVTITSGKDNQSWYYHYKGDYGQSINEFLSEKFEIPQDKFCFFINGKRIRFTKRDVIDDSEVIKVAIQADDNETELLKLIVELGLSRVHSIKIKSQKPGSIFCTLPLSTFITIPVDVKIVCETIITNFKELSNTKIWLAHESERLHEDFNIENLFIQDDDIMEDVRLTLFVNPNKNVKDFCEKHHLVYLREINISFLTGQFTIDLFSEDEIENVEDLKKTINRMKKIPPHLQSLFYDSFGDLKIFDNMQLSSLHPFIMEESLTFRLIVKPVKDVHVNVHCDKDLHKHTIELDLKESDAIADIKQSIANITNHPFSIILVLSIDHMHLEFGDNIIEYDDNTP